MLERFPPVSLEELDRRAAFQRRVDNKYLVPVDLLESTLGALAADHDVLEIEGRRSFRYDSVYFDTAGLDSFRDHVADRTPRIKVRSRLYPDSGISSFELKVKLADGETRKEALEQEPRDHGLLTQRAREFLSRCLDGTVPALEPVLVTRFERSTLVARSGTERVTLDRRVELARPGGGAVRMADDVVLVEAKSETGEAAADRVVRASGVQPVELSKYRVGIGLLVAEDPDPQLGARAGAIFRS